MWAMALMGRAAWPFSTRLARAAAAADAKAPRIPLFRTLSKSSLGPANAADDLAGAAAVAAFLAARGLALAVALGADVLARAGRSGARFIARLHGFRVRLFHAVSPASSSLRARMRSPRATRSSLAFFAAGNISPCSSLMWCRTYSPRTVKVA